jgi:hypothetical protein
MTRPLNLNMKDSTNLRPNLIFKDLAVVVQVPVVDRLFFGILLIFLRCSLRIFTTRPTRISYSNYVSGNQKFIRFPYGLKTKLINGCFLNWVIESCRHFYQAYIISSDPVYRIDTFILHRALCSELREGGCESNAQRERVIWPFQLKS